jgi:hypothetical protein
VIRVGLDVPDRFRRRARYVFSVFAEQWGVPVAFTDAAGEVDVLYSADPPAADDSVVHVPLDPELYDPRCVCRSAADPAGFRLWVRERASAPSTDIVAGAYRLLVFLDERQVAPEDRDRHGIFRAHALPSARRRVADVPLLDEHAACLLARVARRRPAAVGAALPKWPEGKRYAVALTHDTDGIALGAGPELVTNLAKSLIRRDRAHARMFLDGLRYIGRPMDNPLFGFSRWGSFEDARRLRSCFYLFARVVPLKRDLNDCKSSVVEQPIDWRALTRLAEDGWEFGFHAPINAKHRADAMTAGRRWLEQRLGVPLAGIRHHYWALDWRMPHVTFGRHVESGFRYDASIAWKDVAGFRAATCHPFQPFDPDREVPLPLDELPTCVMDGHVLERDGERSQKLLAATETIARVKARGGVAVLDWHTESACDKYVHKGSMATLARILDPLLRDDAWFATPSQIVDHWQRRRKALQAAAS